jgi:hypothetical protein
MHKAGTCIHFNGIQNKTCDAGIAYDSLNFPDGKTHTRILPCLQRLANEASQRTRKPIAECPQRLEPTAQQIAESAAEVKAAIARDLKIKGYRGLHDCPGCGGKQTLHISLASSNNHSRGQCETAGCVAWIE